MKPDKSTLEELYLSQRLATRAIGEQFGVSKTQVLRWLKSYNIERRAVGRGLENRGIVAPNATDLHNMIHTEHLSYETIAKRYGVDTSAITHWVKRHGITPPTIWGTRYAGKPPHIANEKKLCELYANGASSSQLADLFGVSATVITKHLRANGIGVRSSGFGGKRFTCNDGHIVMSIYEQRVDNWLHFHGLGHEVEPKLPFGKRYRGDFLVGDTYIEIWGVLRSPAYTKRRAEKTAKYQEHGLRLVELSPYHFESSRNGFYERILTKALLNT